MKIYLKITTFLLSCGASVGLGMILEKKRISSKTLYCGTLRIDKSEADEAPRLFLELETPLEQLQNIKVASFKVLNRNYIYANKTTPIMDKNQ